MRQGVLISTTEHLLSALIGMGVDNVIVELDNLELPILDGSAQPYVEAFHRAGIRLQRRRRETVRVLRPVEVREGEKFIGIYPGTGYNIRYSIDFPAPIGHQSASVDLAAETYGTEIAPARTFGYKADEQKLRDMGLIRGASAENAIILGAGGPENGPLRFADEYVRHKVLDLIGDLALAGRRIEGQVVAERAGHAMHTARCRAARHGNYRRRPVRESPFEPYLYGRIKPPFIASFADPGGLVHEQGFPAVWPHQKQRILPQKYH
jgi:UDP-3-O-[3-hydroxymyristoyl] N-acetylglucosamine deacetylase